MEPRARAGKNVGKMNFTDRELAHFLYAHGDVRHPIPETIRVLDEIATDFIQSISFEAVRHAHHAGRQKVKWDDFQFAFRRNPRYMGKVDELFEKKKELEVAKQAFNAENTFITAEKAKAERDSKAAEREETKAAAAATAAGAASAGAGAAGKKRGADEISRADDDGEEEPLGELDDDLDVDGEIDMPVAKKR